MTEGCNKVTGKEVILTAKWEQSLQRSFKNLSLSVPLKRMCKILVPQPLLPRQAAHSVILLFVVMWLVLV